MPKWVLGLVGAVGIGGLVGAGAWVNQQNAADEAFVQHQKDMCWRICIQDCQEVCTRNGISPERCECDEHCKRICGY